MSEADDWRDELKRSLFAAMIKRDEGCTKEALNHLDDAMRIFRAGTGEPSKSARGRGRPKEAPNKKDKDWIAIMLMNAAAVRKQSEDGRALARALLKFSRFRRTRRDIICETDIKRLKAKWEAQWRGLTADYNL